MENFVVVGESRSLVAQVLLAIHSIAPARCVVLSGRRTGVLRWSRLCYRHHEVNFYGADDDAFVDRIHTLSASMRRLTLVTADCAAARMVNRVRTRLDIRLAPTPDAAALDCLDNKWEFHQLCVRHGINVPHTIFLESKSSRSFKRLVHELGLPFVVKPLDQAASNGVHVIRAEAQFNAQILTNPDYQFAPLVAQRFVSGQDVGLNLLAIDGEVQALAIQTRDDSKVRFLANAYLEGVAHTLARLCRYDGVMNIDARIEDGSGTVYLFESNPRFWRSLSGSVWCGVNFVGESLAPALCSRPMPRLVSGCADVYYHPLVRPALWGHVLSGRGMQGRMARLMITDPYFFLSSLRPMALTLWQIANRLVLKRRIARVY